MIFGRNRQVRHEQVALPEHLLDERDRAARAAVEPAGADVRGPHDVAARPSTEGYVDLGSLRVPALPGMRLRLDLEDSTGRIVAVTVTMEDSALQVQAFSAPRAEALWDGLREELLEALAQTPGANVQEQRGSFGPELLTRVPAAMPDGSPGWNVARFVGVDGPRWFVRGVFHGQAAFLAEAAAPLEEVFSNIVVVRGTEPLPPRELLPLRPPADAQPMPRRRRPADAGQDVLGADAPEGAGAPGLPERGPETAEVR